jgi:hypothetical protein
MGRLVNQIAISALCMTVMLAVYNGYIRPAPLFVDARYPLRNSCSDVSKSEWFTGRSTCCEVFMSVEAVPEDPIILAYDEDFFLCSSGGCWLADDEVGRAEFSEHNCGWNIEDLSREPWEDA